MTKADHHRCYIKFYHKIQTISCINSNHFLLLGQYNNPKLQCFETTQGMHLLTRVLQSNSTNSLLQQGPRNRAISPSQKWVNENTPVAKPFGWCCPFPPASCLIFLPTAPCAFFRERLSANTNLLANYTMSCWFQTLGLTKFVSREGQPASTRKTLQLHPPHDASMCLSQPARLLFS